MARNMIDANKAIFANLDKHCSAKSDPITNADSARWISTNPTERSFLKDANVGENILFSPGRGLARFDHNFKSYFCTLGFQYITSHVQLSEIGMNAGLATLLLSELSLRPSATTAHIRNIVEYSDGSEAGYDGHDHSSILELFPDMRVFVGENIANDETIRFFFMLCLEENRIGSSWIDKTFSEALYTLCELPRLNIPYDVLCRSVFDADQASMFLALYRCLEALYAYSSTKSLITRFNLTEPWADVSVALEESLGWRPRDEAALKDLLDHAQKPSIDRLFSCIKSEKKESTLSAASEIYRIRNAIVHYRPIHKRFKSSDIDWNSLCVSMIEIIFDVYAVVFSPIKS